MPVQVGIAPSDGHPELYAPPVSHLKDDFPLRPAIAGHLVPQQINIWMGHSCKGDVPKNFLFDFTPADLTCPEVERGSACLSEGTHLFCP